MKNRDKGAPVPAPRRPQARPLFIYWFPVFAWAVIIFMGSSMPPPKIPLAFPHFDKICHFAEYAVLGFLLLRALDSAKARLTGFNLRAAAIVLAAIYGIGNELHQYFIPGRFMELGDIISNAAGAYAGGLFFRTKQ